MVVNPKDLEGKVKKVEEIKAVKALEKYIDREIKKTFDGLKATVSDHYLFQKTSSSAVEELFVTYNRAGWKIRGYTGVGGEWYEFTVKTETDNDYGDQVM